MGGAAPVGLLLNLEPGVRLRLPRCCDDQLRDAVQPPPAVLYPPRRSKAVILQANLTTKSLGSNCVIEPTPEQPAMRLSRVDWTSLPSRVTAPSPVTPLSDIRSRSSAL